MAAPQPNTRQQRETVEFPPNVPVTLALAYSEPRKVSGQRGERFMYSTVDNRALFCDPPVAAQIAQLGINVRESFTITRHSSGKKGTPDTWTVERAAGEQPNGTLVIPKLPDAPAPKPPQRAESATGALVTEANALVDAYAQVLDRALTTYQGRVKPEEVRSLLLSAYIGQQQGRRGAA